jgi:hypothetical protein
MDWVDLAHDRDQWLVLENTVMNLWVPKDFGKFLQLHNWWLLKKDTTLC